MWNHTTALWDNVITLALWNTGFTLAMWIKGFTQPLNKGFTLAL